MKIFKKVKYFSYEEKEALQLEFHNLLDQEMKIHKVNKKGLAAILNMSHDSVYNSFKISTNYFDKKIFAEILKKLQKKTSFRNLRKLRCVRIKRRILRRRIPRRNLHRMYLKYRRRQ